MQKNIVLIIISLFVTCLWAGDLEEGNDALKKDNYAVAIQKYGLAAAKGNAEAQYTLGWMYHSGTGVVRNPVEAVRWYKLAAAQGNGDALNILSLMYELGLQGAIQIDPNEANRLLKLSADKGNRDAQNRLAWRYEKGTGVVKNYGEALRLYKLAAAQDKPDDRLGSMYAEGIGVAQDYIRAHMWWNIVASTGDKHAAELRDQIETKMTRQQVADAQKMAHECQTKKLKNCD